jgi:hypothetical protein
MEPVPGRCPRPERRPRPASQRRDRRSVCQRVQTQLSLVPGERAWSGKDRQSLRLSRWRSQAREQGIADQESPRCEVRGRGTQEGPASGVRGPASKAREQGTADAKRSFAGSVFPSRSLGTRKKVAKRQENSPGGAYWIWARPSMKKSPMPWATAMIQRLPDRWKITAKQRPIAKIGTKMSRRPGYSNAFVK